MLHEANNLPQLIELWETYLLQLDSDEDGPPFMPAGIQASEPQKSDAQLRREAAKAQLDDENAAEAAGEEGAPSFSGTTAIEEGEGAPRESEDTVHEDPHGAGEVET